MKRAFLEKVTIPLLAPILALTGKAAHPAIPAHAVGAGQINNSRASSFSLIPGVAIYGGLTGTETQLSRRTPPRTSQS